MRSLWKRDEDLSLRRLAPSFFFTGRLRRSRLNPPALQRTRPRVKPSPKSRCFTTAPARARDRARYDRWVGQAGASVCRFDITGQDERLRALGLDPRRAPTALHVADDRRRRSALDAYILLLDRIPWPKPLAWPIGPWIRPWRTRLYHRTVEHRLRCSGRPGRGGCRKAGGSALAQTVKSNEFYRKSERVPRRDPLAGLVRAGVVRGVLDRVYSLFRS